MDIKKGTIIKNRYEILSQLGTGGFGTTYKAIDNLVKRFVAIKVSEQDLSHEAKILKALSNVPHISHMYDYFTEKNYHFLVMRLINGKSLSSVQKDNGGKISSSLLKEILPSALITLDQMHANGIIHRDISPGNFLLNDENVLYLIDFGTASSPTHTSLLNQLKFHHKGLDTPERQSAESQGPWTDIYSLCATIFYLLSGEGVPAPADRAMFDEVPTMLLKLSLNTKMQNALIKGLSLNPSKRQKSIHEFANEFFGRETIDNNSSESYSVHYHARTDIGSRDVNQDNYMVDTLFAYAGEDCEIKGYIDCNPNELHVIALADGVASSNHGELASKAAIQAVSHFIDSYKYSDDLPSNLLEEFLIQLNEKILILGKKLGKTATTITIMLWKNNDYIIANIGDSPVYQLSSNRLALLTTPHTVAHTKMEKGEMISPKDLHSLTNYLGKNNIAGCELASFRAGKISKGDIFLMCSDGISGTTTDTDKIKFMKKDGGKAIQSIFKCAHKFPNMDNCTAIILKF